MPVDLKRILDLATAAVQVHGVTDYHAKNVVAIERLKTEWKGKIELVPFPAAVLRDLKKMAVEVIHDRADKSPMAKKVHASFTKFQTQLGVWDTFAEGAYHQLLRV